MGFLSGLVEQLGVGLHAQHEESVRKELLQKQADAQLLLRVIDNPNATFDEQARAIDAFHGIYNKPKKGEPLLSSIIFGQHLDHQVEMDPGHTNPNPPTVRPAPSTGTNGDSSLPDSLPPPPTTMSVGAGADPSTPATYKRFGELSPAELARMQAIAARKEELNALTPLQIEKETEIAKARADADLTAKIEEHKAFGYVDVGNYYDEQSNKWYHRLVNPSLDPTDPRHEIKFEVEQPEDISKVEVAQARMDARERTRLKGDLFAENPSKYPGGLNDPALDRDAAAEINRKRRAQTSALEAQAAIGGLKVGGEYFPHGQTTPTEDRAEEDRARAAMDRDFDQFQSKRADMVKLRAEVKSLYTEATESEIAAKRLEGTTAKDLDPTGIERLRMEAATKRRTAEQKASEAEAIKQELYSAVNDINEQWGKDAHGYTNYLIGGHDRNGDPIVSKKVRPKKSPTRAGAGAGDGGRNGRVGQAQSRVDALIDGN